MIEDRGADNPAMYRWQGGVDAQLNEHGRRLDTINGDAKAARVAAEDTLVQLAVLKTKVALWATAGSLAGAGIVTGAVSLLTRLVS